MRTDLCDLIGNDLPTIHAPMGSASCPALVAEVSNAGGLGNLALSRTKPNDVRQILRETRSLTQRPIGIYLALDRPNAKSDSAPRIGHLSFVIDQRLLGSATLLLMKLL